MPDPFDSMTLPLTPIDPDPVFAARLRARLGRVLVQTIGASTMTTTATTPSAVAPGMAGAAITPYLAVSGAESAIRWYGEAFGARLVGAPIVMPDGSVGHAELDLAGARLMLSDPSEPIGVVAPDPAGGASTTLHLDVADVDTVFNRAAGLGARVERPPTDYPYGRAGVLRDPFGHRWMVMTTPQRGLRHGDIGYVSLWVPDANVAARFFSRVLGWRFAPASGPEGHQVEGLSMHHGLWSNETAHTLFCCYAVDSVHEAIERVRTAGGTAEDPHVEPYGLISMCTDDQGMSFAVFEPVGGTTQGPGPAENGEVHGDLAYVTMEVPNSNRAREFYGSVLGWRFSPGRVEDGWQVDGPAPMMGLAGGHEPATNVPMYRVEDISRAVAAVREAGGSASDPETQPYGITAICTDDQGTRFGLGQL